MNTQEILARVNDALRPYDVIEQAEDSRGYNAETVARQMRDRMRALAAVLEEQIRTETAKSRGTLDATKAVTHMLDAAKADNRRSLGYAWIDDQNRQCACDGFRAFRLVNHLPLEPRPDDAGEPIALDKVFPAYPADDPTMALELPSVQELKAHIAIERAKNGGKRGKDACSWDFGEGKPTVNAHYLLDALAVMGNGVKAFGVATTRKMNARAMIYFTSERGESLLLPINDFSKNDKATEEEREAINAERQRRYHADAMNRMLADYRINLEHDPEYAMSPEQFEILAAHAEYAAA